MAASNPDQIMKCGPYYDQYVAEAESLGMPEGTCIVCRAIQRDQEQEAVHHQGLYNPVTYHLRRNQTDFEYILKKTPDQEL